MRLFFVIFDKNMKYFTYEAVIMVMMVTGVLFKKN